MTENTSDRYDPKRIKVDTQARLIRTGLVSFGLIALAFFIALSNYPRIAARIPQTIMLNDTMYKVNWDILDGFAGLATLSLVIGGLAFAFLEYTQNEIQQRRENAETAFNIYKDVFDRLMSEEDVAARRWLIVNLPTLSDIQEKGGDEKTWLDEVTAKILANPDPVTQRSIGQDYLKHVLNTFDFVGFVAEKIWSMDYGLVEWMNPSIVKVWERVYPFVEQEAADRNEPDYYRSARDLGNYCLEWRRDQPDLPEESNLVERGT